METFDINTIIGMSVTAVLSIIIALLVMKLVNTPVESYYADLDENSKA